MNILIAEDEASLGDLLARALPKIITGSKVVVLADAFEMATTLQTLAEGDKAGWPDIVISDFHLINGDGNSILQLAAKLFPNSKLIMMSGGADQHVVETARTTISRPFTFLQKPFNLNDLIRTILA